MASFYYVPAKSVSDVQTTFVTSSVDSTIVLSILCANTTGSATDITVSVLNNADAELAKLASTITIPADSNVDILGNKLILPSGNKIAFTSAVSGSVDVSISYVEV